MQELVDPRLVVCWRLDETEGEIAYDSVGTKDCILVGGPMWESEDGMMDGALGFDGADDYVRTYSVVDPTLGSFTGLAWIKGGAPGQALVSQVNGVNWLMVDPSVGTLATELAPPGRRVPVPLVSDTVVTDDVWHRVAFA